MSLNKALRLRPGTNIIVLYDGVCNVCNSSVQFAVRHNSRPAPPYIHFASLQSRIGKRIIETFHISAAGRLETSVLLRFDVSSKSCDADDSEDDALLVPQIFTRSDASLHLARYLDFPMWVGYYAGLAVPKAVRDPFYDWFAKNRYANFGRTDLCQIPPPSKMTALLVLFSAHR
ncbi:hypothetical protein BC936DRAFT_141786 [Jimgerdemannia flammicorona]|uniref:Uncharacterized protein n=2 Tax=Jimgerdemannia flammicorona TaxID=994334 RepID=A0A433QHK2_9FUNG|nr:hypothetical protein BC936DRAFT_141786 [Jimgerdemannia flammicorona]RUS29300.1 hypothetical protein BC938DRAFT_480819 [Jimgerdemannia flammicorona]